MSHLRRSRLLRNLNLEGNPITRRPHYRYHVIDLLPQLERLDKREVTVDEREAAASIVVNEKSRLRECVRRDCSLVKLKACERLLHIHAELRDLAFGRPGALSRHRDPPKPCFRLCTFMKLWEYEALCPEVELSRVRQIMENDVIRIWTAMCLERVRDRTRVKHQQHRSDLWSAAYATVASLQHDAFVRMSSRVEVLAESTLRKHLKLVGMHRLGKRSEPIADFRMKGGASALVVRVSSNAKRDGLASKSNVNERRCARRGVDRNAVSNYRPSQDTKASRQGGSTKSDLEIAKEVLRVRLEVERQLKLSNQSMARDLKIERDRSALEISRAKSRISDLETRVMFWRARAENSSKEFEGMSRHATNAMSRMRLLSLRRIFRSSSRLLLRSTWNRFRRHTRVASTTARFRQRLRRGRLQRAFNKIATRAAVMRRRSQRPRRQPSDPRLGTIDNWKRALTSQSSRVSSFVTKLAFRKKRRVFLAWASTFAFLRKFRLSRDARRRYRLRRAFRSLRSHCFTASRENAIGRLQTRCRRMEDELRSCNQALERSQREKEHLRARLYLATWRASVAGSVHSRRVAKLVRARDAEVLRENQSLRAKEEATFRAWTDRVERVCAARVEEERELHVAELGEVKSSFASKLREAEENSLALLEKQRQEAISALENANREVLQNQESAILVEATNARKDIAHQQEVVALNATIARNNLKMRSSAKEMKDTVGSMSELLEKQEKRMATMEDALEVEMETVERLRRMKSSSRAIHSHEIVDATDERDRASINHHLPNIAKMAERAASQIASAVELSSSSPDPRDPTDVGHISPGRVEQILVDEISALEKALLNRLEPVSASLHEDGGNHTSESSPLPIYAPNRRRGIS